MPERIQLRRTKGWRLPANTVVVARPSKWGNPFTIARAQEAGYARTGNVRGFVVECLREWLTPGPSSDRWWMGPESDAKKAAMRRNLTELRGKNLACWCRLCPAHATGKPLGVTCDACAPCHADVLLELANRPLRCEAV